MLGTLLERQLRNYNFGKVSGLVNVSSTVGLMEEIEANYKEGKDWFNLSIRLSKTEKIVSLSRLLNLIFCKF